MDHRSPLVEIGALAHRTGTAASAIRYYEQLGLLRPDERRGGRRRYSERAAERLALIRLCREVGFSLSEIGNLLSVRKRSPRAWSDLAERKVEELNEQIVRAETAKGMLEHALNCPSPDLLACPHFRDELQARLA